MIAPTLQTERLILRAPKLADFERWAEFFASERSIHERGQMPRDAAWENWAADAALWPLDGYGAFGLDDCETGAYVGGTGIYEPEGYPEPEPGRFTVPKAEGKGYAAEAARAVLDWAAAAFHLAAPLMSLIDTVNKACERVAEKLGATVEAQHQPNGGQDILRWRHSVAKARPRRLPPVNTPALTTDCPRPAPPPAPAPWPLLSFWRKYSGVRGSAPFRRGGRTRRIQFLLSVRKPYVWHMPGIGSAYVLHTLDGGSNG